MIDKKELRLGNTFADLSGNVHTVKGIHEDCIVTQYFRACISDFGPPNEKDGIWPAKSISFEDAQPIPLTPEILEKCGFVDTNNGYRATGSEVVYELSTPKKVRLWWQWPDVWVFESWNGCKIKHLHQLQNLIFAITSSELEVTP